MGRNNTAEIKAIQTIYNGYKFRSRLEARWAVYFDDQGIKYEYEKEGFDLGKGKKYLPDFWLPQVNMWAEVKPEIDDGRIVIKGGGGTLIFNYVGDDYLEQLSKIAFFVKQIQQPCLLLYGLPEAHPYEAMIPPSDFSVYPYAEDYCVTNYHGYVFDEHRFYCEPGSGDTVAFDGIVESSIVKAKSARFEYGEGGDN